MARALGVIIGGLEIAAGIVVEILSPGNAVGWYLIAGGAGAVIGGIGTLLNAAQSGLSTAARNPVQPWTVIYGRVKTGGTYVYVNSFGDNDKYLDLVLVLASHPCQSVDTLLFDNQRVLINPSNNTSYSPTQHTVNISSISRAQGVVTVTMAATISDLQEGDQIQIQNVSSGPVNDRSLNGIFYVATLIDSSHFTYLSGGQDISLGTTGQVKTLWPDYRSKVYCEFLLGNQTTTFNGMLNGTPYDGDTGDLQTLSNNPWTAQHVLNGKTCAFLRLHYNDQVFSNGLPQISFRLHGKKDIYDPRNDNVVARPTVSLNGWGNNAHEGAYEGGVDQGYEWGLNDDTTYSYDNAGSAIDGNLSSYASSLHRHTHKYAGCIWTFGATTGATYLNILSAVPSSGPGSLRSAGIYYSLDGGTTWTMVYDTATRAQQWDNISLPGGQDTSLVQVMAFLDSHDDMTQQVYDIHLGTGPSSFSGYTENAALCIADYLSNTVWGFRAKYGTEISAAQLITAANICDEDVALASGGTEKRYLCNGQFQLSTRRGEVLQNMLTACGGRITYCGGQFVIHPAAWEGVSWDIGGKAISSATVYVISANFPAVSSGTTGISNITVGSAAVGVDAHHIVYAPDYPKETDSSGLNSGELATGIENLEIYCRNFQTLNLSTDPLDPSKVLIYDCWIVATHPDSSTTTYKPTMTRVEDPAIEYGRVDDANLAIDSDDTTCATINRFVYSSLVDYNIQTLVLSGFLPVGGTGAPDTSPGGITASKAVLGLTAGPFTWKSKLPIRDLYNGVKGTYISPANGWQNSDFPPYAQDGLHGYSGPGAFENDQNLADDGGDRRWEEIQLPFTISYTCAQRLAKIELLRKRWQGQGTFAFNMSFYQTTALDILALTLPILGWTGKLLEVNAHRLMMNKQGETPLLGCELDLQETDPSIYEWSVSEELAPQGGNASGALPDTRTVAPPTSVTAISGSSTTITGADGISRSRILTSWTPPVDGFVLNGGRMEVQYQRVTSPVSTTWTGLPSVDPSVTQVFIDSVTDGQQYIVQVRAVNAAGVPSNWVAAPPVTVSGTPTTLPPGNIASGGAAPGEVLTWTGSPPGWVPAPATGIELQTNSVDNTLQTKLNLKSGTNVTLTADSLGGVTIAAAGGTSVAFTSETPSGTLNGTNTAFTLSATPTTGSLHLYLNGVEQVPTTDYTISSTTITYVVPPKSTDYMIAEYTH
jgi:hypothetical protein